ncbi:hypothetical protein tooticki91_gp015 [Flavobacterium phage vB_FspS_tooticki9-1]|uniref:Uncharacterized protein n=31 Tax=Caudoviricetes TaxID=2731619 RepID=A0A6B9LPF7_9CAUD|nr:hypothetical protein HWC87_gp21 [Flavobacterium phage vB_FspS_filifjonk9-1]YP_009854669.1 hypothetical protein HWC88_gp17 [Flavobacterium phage vB_FspS_hattifnatt9-1]YP_009854748.1 hypothetical protein HWC89_gp20 [Flavobacterium phage vB_FspS_hemulen6-1]YP_009854878.1 hypothetical protein HWC91_gp23 [Flavobacterium phage vB_FspS_lillamy9-1]YP_009854951.1 hypothetical protein HWC92_gp23 [Flavobacterium phage vB_FspS_morran9-1]YP_009855018.1 hypothetical protein HWC93_gp17 [Flavobacterium pha
MSIKSQKLWIESQEMLIEQLKLQKENAEMNICLNKRLLKNTKESIKHEENILRKFLETYKT